MAHLLNSKFILMILNEPEYCTKGTSAKQLSKRYDISYKAAWLFGHKVRRDMKSSYTHPMKDRVLEDEFVIGGKEEDKQGRSYDTKKKRSYSQ